VTTENAKTLPKTLPGVVCEQWKRCGQKNCRCSRGDLHGPYYYRFWRQAGRLCKTYVRKSDVVDIRGRCLARRQDRAELHAALQEIQDMALFLKGLEQR
jgi:hypothetical protein